MCLRFLAAACLLGAAGTASAAEFIEGGVYLSSDELCAQARADGIEDVLGEGSLALTASGLHGYEYHCDFLQVLEGKRTPGWTVIAMCEEPGFSFSDLITIRPHGEGRLQLMSLALRQADEDSPASIEDYVLCEGVDLP